MPVWLTPFVMPVVAFALAAYGWHLITQLAKRREAHDLYGSVLSLLEQLDADGRDAWGGGRRVALDGYTEQKFLSKILAIEQRLGLIHKHYYPADPHGIASNQLWILREYLTAYPLKNSPEKSRTVAIHALIADMVGNLLEENYAYINQNPWIPTTKRPANHPPPLIRWVLLCIGLGLLWVAVYYLYALVIFGPLFFAEPLRVIEYLPMAMLGVITPGLWALLRPWRLAAGRRRGIVIGYIAAMPVAFFLALGFRMLIGPVVWCRASGSYCSSAWRWVPPPASRAKGGNSASAMRRRRRLRYNPAPAPGRAPAFNILSPHPPP